MRTTKERAAEIIKRHEETGQGDDLDYFRAVLNDTVPNYYAETLYVYSLCSDALPPHIANPTDQDYPFMKCRGNFFNGLLGDLDRVTHDQTITDRSTISLINTFIRYPWHFGFNDDPSTWTTQTEIDLTNLVIGITLRYLERTYNLKLDHYKLQAKLDQLRYEARHNWRIE